MVFLEHLGFELLVGMHVHVREVEGRDKGKNKVYRVLRIRPKDDNFEGEYWEQPSFDGSSLVAHDFEAEGHTHFKELPEVVLIPKKWWLPMKLVQALPVFAFHWTTIVEIEATPIGMAGAYVFGRRIKQSIKGIWSSRALPSDRFPPFWQQSTALQKLCRVSYTQHVWSTYRLLGETIQTVLTRGSPEEWSDSEIIRGFDVVRWNLLCNLHPIPCKEQPIKEVTKKLMVTFDFGFFMKASHEVVQTLSFSSKQELHQLTTALGRFWNLALYNSTISHLESDKFRAHVGMNIKAVHPTMSACDKAHMVADPSNYRKKRKQDEEGKDVFGGVCRMPGVYLTFRKPTTSSTGSLTVSVSWHDKPHMGEGWDKEVMEKLLV